MSNTAPPPPPWQGGSSPSGLTEGAPPPPSSSKAPKIIAALVIVAAIVVVIVLVTGGDDDGGGGANAAAAHDGLEAIVDDADDFQESGFETFSRCPIIRLDDVVEQVAAKTEVADELIDGSDISGIIEIADSPFVFCLQQPDDSDDVGDGVSTVAVQAVLEPPSDFEEFLADVNADSDEDVEFDDAGSFSGGTLYVGCSDDSCTAVWHHAGEKIAIAFLLEGDDVDAAQTTALLRQLIPDVTSSLADQAGDAGNDEEE